MSAIALYAVINPCLVQLNPPQGCPGYDTKQSDSEVPVMLELWRMWCTPSLPSLPCPFWPGVVVTNRPL